jgi:hypothetical protein
MGSARKGQTELDERLRLERRAATLAKHRRAPSRPVAELVLEARMEH